MAILKISPMFELLFQRQGEDLFPDGELSVDFFLAEAKSNYLARSISWCTAFHVCMART
jgi:hypothetical protein